jgi:hypothetical protein
MSGLRLRQMKPRAIIRLVLDWVKAVASINEIRGKPATWTQRRGIYRVTPRANPRVFRRELLSAAMLQLKQTQDGS